MTRKYNMSVSPKKFELGHELAENNESVFSAIFTKLVTDDSHSFNPLMPGGNKKVTNIFTKSGIV